jgi:hypothetical protein
MGEGRRRAGRKLVCGLKDYCAGTVCGGRGTLKSRPAGKKRLRQVAASGQWGEYVHLGAVRDHRIQGQEISVKHNGGQVVERFLL